MAKVPRRSDAIRELRRFFARNGYVRRQNIERVKDEGYREYKKGDEVRLVAESLVELRLIRRLLQAMDFKPGRPFRKAKQWRQPIYGRREVARFLSLVRKRRPRKRS